MVPRVKESRSFFQQRACILAAACLHCRGPAWKPTRLIGRRLLLALVSVPPEAAMRHSSLG